MGVLWGQLGVQDFGGWISDLNLEGGGGVGGVDDMVIATPRHDAHLGRSWGWGGKGWGGGVKYRMLHIPGILDYTYHLHVSVSVCSRF